MPLMLASDIIVQSTKEGIEDNAVSIVVPDAVVYLPLEDLVDFEQEKERLDKGRRETDTKRSNVRKECLQTRSS